jgi:serine/threonine protein kinase
VRHSLVIPNSVIYFGQANILVDEDEHPRICDYGLAFIIEPSNFTSTKTAEACRWTAPEIMNPPEDITYADDSFALFTKESDVYAFAMTVLEVNSIFHDPMASQR